MRSMPRQPSPDSRRDDLVASICDDIAAELTRVADAIVERDAAARAARRARASDDNRPDADRRRSAPVTR